MKQTLFGQFILLAILPFFFMSLITAFWIFPRVVKIKANEKIEFSKNIALRIEKYLANPEAVLLSVSNFMSTLNRVEDYRGMLELQMDIPGPLKAVYIVSSDGKVVDLVLKDKHQGHGKDLISMDLSESPMVLNTIKDRKPVWSDTFKSLITGDLSVGVAIPSGEFIIVGEIGLEHLSDFLTHIAGEKEQIAMILDRKGQVIAHTSWLLTGQEPDLTQLSFVKKALDDRTDAVSADFRIDGRAMSGYMVNTLWVDWKILVAQSQKEALRPLWTGFAILGIVLAATLCAGVLLSLVLSARLAKKFGVLTRYARRIAAGKEPGELPVFTTYEFKSLTQDIQAMADSIKEREAYSRILFADSPVPLLVIRPDSLACFDANGAALRLLNVPSSESISGRTLLSFSLPEQDGEKDAASKMKAHIKELSDQGEVNFEWAFFDKYKGVWFGNVSLSVFHHGITELVQMSIIDITKAKTEESQRKKLEKQLIDARKMESIGTLAGGIAHDFNNILFPVLGFTEIIMDDIPEDSPLRPSFVQIFEGCLKAKELVNQLLIFSRQDSRKYVPLQIQAVIGKVLEEQIEEIPKNIQASVDISPEGGQVMADYDHIYLVVSNLLTNAVSAMEAAGGVLKVVSGDIQVMSGDSYALDLIPGWYVCLKVSDTGPGIPPEIQDSIFDPYFSTKGKGEAKGTGLGLAVVHGIVKSYQGKIIVESRTGKGTVFNVYLPRHVPAGKTPDNEDAPNQPEESKKILLVDDEKTYLSMMEESLKRMGYSVTAFDNGINAMQAFEAHESEFDLVITDLLMPGMNGDKLARLLKEKQPDIPVILCTGFSDRIDEDDMSARRIDEVLTKPVLRDELAKVIRKVLNK